MNSVEVRNACAAYEKDSSGEQLMVLDKLNMTVTPGSIYALIGSSGCGKTTLLSCILGMKSLDSGSITLLGHKVTNNKPSEVARFIGYMPQDTALSSRLTVSETLNYFGNIFLMNKHTLEERTRMIMELLELPSDDRQIEHLSGGQQRRVSLAAAIIHNPLILILDEPTVGLDSILRKKIWDFLIKTTSESNLSIIITTHYISEAQQSDRCGMMRDGVLLVEDSPSNILSEFEASSLDEAFLNLCKSSKRVVMEGVCVESDVINDIGVGQETSAVLTHSIERRERFAQIIATLFWMEWVCVKRSTVELAANFFYLPLLSVLLFFGPGGNPNGLVLGVVNYEVSEWSRCDAYLRLNGSYRNEHNDCVYRHLSCHFLNEIRDEEDGEKVFYESLDAALADAKRGKLRAVIAIHGNFSEALQRVHESFDGTAVESSEIAVHLDQTDMQISTFVSNRLLKAYGRFAESVMLDCGYNRNFAKSPLEIVATFGSLYGNFQRSLLPIFLLQSAFIQAVSVSCYRISQSKMDGIWNRTLLAGVHPLEVLVVHFVSILATLAVALTNALLVLLLLLDVWDISIILTALALGICLGIAGISVGILLSTFSKNAIFMTVLIFGGSIVAVTTSGLFWPVEGQPDLFKHFSYALPFALTSTSLRNIVTKGFGVTEASVYKGFLIILAWTAGALSIAIVSIRKSKFS